jgi:hypothetical protein
VGCGVEDMNQTFDGPVIVENPAEILRNQDGIFEVTSPYGHVFQVVCRRGSQMNVHEITEPESTELSPTRFVWHIKKIEHLSALT